MNQMKYPLSDLDSKTKLSAMWAFVLFNIVFKDIHQLFVPGFIEQIQTGVVNGIELSIARMLIADIQMEGIILMVILSRILPRKINRGVNIIVACLSMAYGVLTMNGTEGIVYLSLAVLTGAAIIWTAWRWEESKEDSLIMREDTLIDE